MQYGIDIFIWFNIFNLMCLTEFDHTIPQVWLEKMNKAFTKHPHYKGKTGPADRTIPDNSFKLVHYAGDVVYNVEGFLDKNTDTLYKDLSRVSGFISVA